MLMLVVVHVAAQSRTTLTAIMNIRKNVTHLFRADRSVSVLSRSTSVICVQLAIRERV